MRQSRPRLPETAPDHPTHHNGGVGPVPGLRVASQAAFTNPISAPGNHSSPCQGSFPRKGR